MHFFNPAPVMKLVEVVRTVVTEPDVVDDVEAFAAAARQDRRHDRRPGRLHRQRAAVRLPQPRGLAVRVALRQPRGHRRGDEARLRAADGPAGAARPDRPRHRLRDPRHDVPAEPRPAARAAPDPQADDHRRVCSAARSGRGFYTYDEPGSPNVVADAATPPDRPEIAGRPRRSARSAWSARARWPPASSRCSPRPATTSLFVARSQDKVDKVDRRRSPARWTRRCSAASSPRTTATPRWRGSPARPSLDDLADVRPGRRGGRRGPAVKQALFANLDDICKPGAVLATTTSSLPVIECAAATSRPADVIGMHFFNPARDHEAGRGGHDGVDRRRTSRRPCST